MSNNSNKHVHSILRHEGFLCRIRSCAPAIRKNNFYENISSFPVEAHPHSRDVDIPELAVKAAVDEKLTEAKELLDQYFEEAPVDLRKRAVRLLRLGK
ncbi:hypothetical protein ACTXT7_005969 [Hymenolepis weldensis]